MKTSNLKKKKSIVKSANKSSKGALKHSKKMKKVKATFNNKRNNLEAEDIQDVDQLETLTQASEKKSAVKKKKKLKKNNVQIESSQDMDQLEISTQAKCKKSGVKRKKNLKKNDVQIENPKDTHDQSNIEADETGNSSKGKKTFQKGILLQRYEPALDISEFNLTEVGKEKVKLDELIKTSQKLAGQVLVKKQLESAKKLRSLSVPLSKPQLEKIKRTVAYEKVCNEVSKWDSVVRGNRAATQITYPLKKPELRLENIEEASESFVTKHPVQEAVSELLKTSDNALVKTKELTPAEEKALQAMSLEEAKLRHNELMKHRALISYKEAKARQRNKIKSKRYHRILKREKLKKMMKEFEELEKTDAAAALEKYLEADKLRVLERMTLKHRNTGKWAKQQKLRAKYNPESRSSLKEDLITGRQLREKIGAEDTVAKLKMKITESSTAANEEPDMSLLHNRGLVESTMSDNGNDIESMFQIDDEYHDSLDTEEFPHVLDNHAMKDQTNNTATALLDRLVLKKPRSSEQNKEESNELAKQPKKAKSIVLEDDMDFSSEVTCLNSLVPDDITFGDEDLDDTTEERITIQQAFADEDFISEFKEDKRSAERANKPETINLFLPGWGSWGGPGIKASRRKKQRFLIKPVELPSKKNTLGNVIINEDKDAKAAAHQVSHLPFPFTNVHQFESYIRQPIGNTWNPQSSFQNLVAPKVITKMGKIIDPIDAEDVILETKTKQTKVKKGKRNLKQNQLTAF
ncbi:U3 small nucleolar RNA-associated protein 14 homolog A-like [Uloborus diversus]|uniref:U3 small nucleolar RNA-associated protein 14 homolog A-like n=1 Tax=Uloborus diversus TaxID=327109 RepID=UPI0024097324|nr:U3 small nucleolar RNA-associated protein 14 homolog A-like [Uloborus diversus]